MDSQWREFRNAPNAYVLANKGNANPMISAMTEVICSEQERDEQLKILMLTTWQEMAQVLFKDTSSLESAISTLSELFKQQRGTANSFFLSQILCTITSLLIQTDEVLPGHQVYLIEFIIFLFEIIEKVKSESNLLLKSMACDCLTELEMSFPGLLASKVGHFYGMSQAETSYVHQHYTMLFTTVLDNALQLFILQQSGNSFQAQDTLIDLLSHSDSLKSFSLPDTFKEHAHIILTKSHFQPPLSSSLAAEKFSEVKKGVLSVIDSSYLLTPPCLANVAHKLISIVDSCGSLPSKVLKRLLSHSSSSDLQLFHMVLTLQDKFGMEICDAADNENINTRQLIHAGQPQLPAEQRALVWSWLLKRLDSPSPDWGDLGSPLPDEGALLEGLSERIMAPTVFDSLDIFLYKCKALFKETHSNLPKSFRQIAGYVLKMVEYDTSGPPAVTLYRVLLAYLKTDDTLDSARTKEVEKLVLDLTLAHPQLIPHTIDFIGAVQRSQPESHLPLNVLSEITHYLVSVDLSQILIYLHLHLQFIRHAATNHQISPTVLVQLLLRILKESSICKSGVWDIGNIILDISTTFMQLHQTEVIFKDLSSLLQLLAQEYNDLDIRDRACFYHQLLLTVSGEKLFAILSLASNTATGSSLAAIVEARISDNVFPSAPPVKVLQVHDSEPFLTLCRERKEECGCHYPSDCLDSAQSTDFVETYFERIDSQEESVRKCPIRLQYQISYEKRPKDISQRIFALVLKLSTTGPYYSSPDIFLPCLSASSKSSSESSKLITLSFYPKQPVPAEFNVNVTFSTDDGLSYSVTLEPIKLRFSDLFQPVDIPPSVSTNDLFEALWGAIETSDQEGKTDTQRVLSTMRLQLYKEEWQFSCTELHSFEVPSTTTNQGNHKVLIFLPPSYHLLLWFQLSNELSTVFMATDNWEALPLTHSYLQQLITSNS